MLEAKAAEYLSKRRLKQVALGTASVAVSKSGEIIDAGLFPEPATGLAANQVLIEIVKDQCKVFYQGQQISVPSC
ncbi:hypothetical protein GCM10025778_14270 [Paeniglutamicibacter antarcticus]|uniref:Cytidine deaminase n=1 Tax=Paeniglutamicibacter antarcticus TaxID=494023 RepID=A0ABP9TJB7_9MICC